jgi:hypothetical protein
LDDDGEEAYPETDGSSAGSSLSGWSYSHGTRADEKEESCPDARFRNFATSSGCSKVALSQEAAQHVAGLTAFY